MSRKTVVSPGVCKKIGSFGLNLPTLIQLVTRLHEDLPFLYDRFRRFRYEKDERVYRQAIVISEGSTKHLFSLTIDDSTSPDHLGIADIWYSRHNF